MIEKLKRAALVMCAASGLILALPETALASPTPTFAHWSSAGPGGASGSLLGASVSLSGPMGTAFYLHDDYPNFNSPAFTPALAATGMVEIRGGPGHAFTLSFGAPIQNPVIDLGSFGSVLTFPSGTVLTRLSGDSGLQVSGNVVTNGAAPVDVNGTIKLTGTYTTITFTLTYPGTDGIFFQVGGTR
jgi:hypothetical protein